MVTLSEFCSLKISAESCGGSGSTILCVCDGGAAFESHSLEE